MTAQEKLHAVETAIRKALPRLMEPTEGCYLERKGNIYKIVNKRYHSALLSQYSNHIYFAISPNYHQKPDFLEISEKYLNEYEMLGHDILLSDVLEWLRLFNNDYCLWDGMILKPVGASNYYAEFETINGESFDKNIIEWNLPKPRLADQSEEFIDFLYNLIKE